jgi:predicted nucleic acid-binding protein
VFARADVVFTSQLTLVECDRALIRAMTAERLSAAETARVGALLSVVAGAWIVMPLATEVLERARRPFPVEPMRTLDAIHLASALTARSVATDLEFASLDPRLRTATRAVGLSVRPA